MSGESSDELDLTTRRRVHVVGIGGAGMSAIAEVLAAMGHDVSGSDLKDSPGLERLRALGLEVSVGHAAENLGEVDAVARSTAVPETNPELVAAADRGIRVLSRAETLRAITRTRRTIAVAGTHGKTTTSSMLALVLREAGFAPSFIIGGDVNEIGTGAAWDEGEWLVVEADESDGTFLELVAEAGIVTSVEPDHLEHYGGVEPLLAAFQRFVGELSGPVVICADDPVSLGLGDADGRSGGPRPVTYGTEPGADYRMTGLEVTGRGCRFDLQAHGRELGELQLPVPGAHNARNACAAVALALEVGAPFDAARLALGRFGGVARRFQHRGEVGGVTFVDDYAHLPSEARAALSAARAGEWTRVVCVFQPHRYSRTASLASDFADAFEEADLLVVTDVYAAGETPRPGVSGKLVLEAVLRAHPWVRAAYLPRRSEVRAYLAGELRAGDLCLTLGAGDLTSLPDELMDELAERELEGVAG